jgi:hypothetical protein
MWLLTRNYLLLCMGICLVSCGAKDKKDPDKIYFEKASDYNQYIRSQFDEVNRLWNASLAVMDDSTLIYNALDSLKIASRQSILNMRKLADFKGDTNYKHAAAEYFSYMLTTANGSYAEAIEIGLMEDISDSLYFRFISISNQIGADKDSCISRLKTAQLRFTQLTKQ